MGCSNSGSWGVDTSGHILLRERCGHRLQLRRRLSLRRVRKAQPDHRVLPRLGGVAMPVNGNGQYEYPLLGWSTGKTRKRGQKENGDYAEWQVAMEVRRGEPQLEEPGIAEA